MYPFSHNGTRRPDLRTPLAARKRRVRGLVGLVTALLALTALQPIHGRSVMTQRRAISTGAAPDALFSPAVVAGGLVFVVPSS